MILGAQEVRGEVGVVYLGVNEVGIDQQLRGAEKPNYFSSICTLPTWRRGVVRGVIRAN
jgi:hypothetical protein